MVGLDKREIWAVTCLVYGHWQMEDETAVILQSLSWFSDGPNSRAVDIRRHVETRFDVAETSTKVILEAVSVPWLMP